VGIWAMIKQEGNYKPWKYGAYAAYYRSGTDDYPFAFLYPQEDGCVPICLMAKDSAWTDNGDGTRTYADSVWMTVRLLPPLAAAGIELLAEVIR
jgi:hypothetical protein